MTKYFKHMTFCFCVALLVGCGEESSNNNSESQNIAAPKAYDLASYLATPIDSNNSYDSYFYSDGGLVAANSLDDYERSLVVTTVESEQVLQSDEDNNTLFIFNRNADINDTIAEHDISSSSPGMSSSGTVECILAAHHDALVLAPLDQNDTFALSEYSYADVVEIECMYDLIYIQNNIAYPSHDKKTLYFASGIGIVGSYNEDCYDGIHLYFPYDDASSCVAINKTYELLDTKQP